MNPLSIPIKRHRLARLCLFILVFTQLIVVKAQIRLPAIISDNMVLQREATVTIWGWGNTGEKVNLSFAGKKYNAVVGADSKWSLFIRTKKAGGPYKMEIATKDSKVAIENILLGDVWLCSGQSNMDHYLGRHQDRFQKEIENSQNSEIRQVIIPKSNSLSGPSEDMKPTKWVEADPKSILDFTVVGYFFAKHIYEQYKVPIGLIKSTVGGTPIQAWTSEEGLKEFPDLIKTITQNKDTAYLNDIFRKIEKQKGSVKRPSDAGLSGAVAWFDPDYEPKGWNTMNIPGYWEDQGIRNLNGTVWFRKEVNVPRSMIGKPARIDMGRIVDADKVYINGKMVGSTGYQYPQRRYHFGTDVLKEGLNAIVVQVVNNGGKGGFVPDKPYYLAVAGDTLDLKGTWSYKVGNVFKPEKKSGRVSFSSQNQPSALYNTMIAPIRNYKMKGALWYQGESNAWSKLPYDQLMKSLISDWRKQWENPDLPFFYVQLPNYMDVNYLPEESKWAELRFAQFKSLEVENTAMAVALNLGEWNDIHPGDKKPIGDRLALAARNKAYGEKDLVYSGPLYQSAERKGSKVILSFDHVGDGLLSNDGEPLKWFSIADERKNFVWAKAEIINNQVVVSNEEITNPVYVRYAWMDNPDRANFFNKNGLPASPFEVKIDQLK